jgi:hypothetical protein
VGFSLHILTFMYVLKYVFVRMYIFIYILSTISPTHLLYVHLFLHCLLSRLHIQFTLFYHIFSLKLRYLFIYSFISAKINND